MKHLHFLPLFFIAFTLAGCEYADLRNSSVKDGVDQNSMKRGRALLKSAAERAGLYTWRAFRTKEFVAVDEWSGNSPWWPSNPQRFRMRTVLNSFSSRVELLDGSARQEIWGIQSWVPFVQKPGQTQSTILDQNRAIEFYLPTLQYFDELSFRILAAPLITDARKIEFRDESYHRVFATWGSWEPHPDFDQYELWINDQSGLIEMVHYTVRDAVKFSPDNQKPMMKALSTGTIHFSDFRSVQGVLMPFVQIVTLGSPRNSIHPVHQNFFHKLTVDSASYDTVSADQIYSDPGRPEIGDKKK